MGVMKRKKQEQQERRGRRRSKAKPEVSWGDVDDDIIVGFIQLTEELDGAVRFGRSRDRAVYSLGFYIGEDRFTEWIPGGPDAFMAFQNLFIELSEDYSLKAGDGGDTLDVVSPGLGDDDQDTAREAD